MLLPYKAILRQMLIETTALYQLVYQYITCYYCISFLFENECPRFTHATFILRRPRCVPFMRRSPESYCTNTLILCRVSILFVNY
jgi:hypothetical protein